MTRTTVAAVLLFTLAAASGCGPKLMKLDSPDDYVSKLDGLDGKGRVYVLNTVKGFSHRAGFVDERFWAIGPNRHAALDVDPGRHHIIVAGGWRMRVLRLEVQPGDAYIVNIKNKWAYSPPASVARGLNPVAMTRTEGEQAFTSTVPVKVEEIQVGGKARERLDRRLSKVLSRLPD